MELFHRQILTCYHVHLHLECNSFEENVMIGIKLMTKLQFTVEFVIWISHYNVVEVVRVLLDTSI